MLSVSHIRNIINYRDSTTLQCGARWQTLSVLTLDPDHGNCYQAIHYHITPSDILTKGYSIGEAMIFSKATKSDEYSDGHNINTQIESTSIEEEDERLMLFIKAIKSRNTFDILLQFTHCLPMGWCKMTVFHSCCFMMLCNIIATPASWQQGTKTKRSWLRFMLGGDKDDCDEEWHAVADPNIKFLVPDKHIYPAWVRCWMQSQTECCTSCWVWPTMRMLSR